MLNDNADIKDADIKKMSTNSELVTFDPVVWAEWFYKLPQKVFCYGYTLFVKVLRDKNEAFMADFGLLFTAHLLGTYYYSRPFNYC